MSVRFIVVLKSRLAASHSGPW